MHIEPLTPAIGAEISGVDLARPLDDRAVAAIRAALLVHHVLFFRDQALDPPALLDFACRFGAPYEQPPGWTGDYVHPHVFPIRTDAASTINAGPDWHSDLSCAPRPPMAAMLHLHELPPAGGDTLFASTAAAYDALSPPLRTWLDGLVAEHAWVYEDGAWPDVRAQHPVVASHGETGRRGLFVNRSYTRRILGLTPEESRALLAFLTDHIARPEFHCRFRWSPDALAFWDNRAAQHLAIWDYRPHVRAGHRVDIAQPD